MLVHDFLARSADRCPDGVGLVCGGGRFTYRELDDAANRLARALRTHGARRGDRVAIFLPNCVEAVVGIFATLKAGATFVVIHATTKPEKVEYILNDCSAVALLADATAAQGLDRSRVPALKWVVVREKPGPTVTASGIPSVSGWDSYAAVQERFACEPGDAGVIDLDLACLIYTSGSTGEPKGVMCDHSNVVFVTEAIIEYLGNTSSDVVLSVLPLSFSYGLYQLMASVACGSRLVLEDSFAFPAVILKRMGVERVTGFAGVPTLFAILLKMDFRAFDLSSLRYMTNAAAALPPEHVRQLRQRLPGVALYLMHGLTEVARTVFLAPEAVDARPDSVGRAIPGTEVWLEDDQGRRVPAGEVGEMVVRGRHVMRGYWNNPEATRQRFRPGAIPGERCCHTGDLFRTDEAGYFYFVARQDDIIKCRGEKVAPREVENVLYRLEGVTEAAVIGVPDPVMGEAIKAFVVAPGRELTVQQVLAHCKAHLEDLMVPKLVEIRTELPKTATGKIRKLELR